MEFVINEWFIEYMRPQALPDEKIKLKQFLHTFLATNDKIFVRRPSEFLNKIYKYTKIYSGFPNEISMLRAFIKLVLFNSDKCVLVDDKDFLVDDDICNLLMVPGRNFSSDLYLFEAAIPSINKIIVTTDVKLKEWVGGKSNIEVVLLDDFLKEYNK